MAGIETVLAGPIEQDANAARIEEFGFAPKANGMSRDRS